MVMYLLKKGSQVDHVWHNISLLHLAVRKGHMDMIDLMLQMGLDVNLHTKLETPLHLACADGSLELAKVITSRKLFVNIDTTSLVEFTGMTFLELDWHFYWW